MSIAADQSTEEAVHEMMRNHVKVVAEAMLRDWWGERCPDFDPDCECCKHWYLLDQLVDEDNRPPVGETTYLAPGETS